MTEVACPSCGEANPPGNRFCGSCGSSLDVSCGACGAMNPLANRFCGSCGTSLGPPTAASEPVSTEERKVVTMLFADLTASTEMASRLDPEDLRAVLRPFYDAMAEEVERFGGTVERFIGDAVVAAFGAPIAHEDDPERSVRCAAAMHRHLAELNRELADRAGGDLAMRIGINTGDVIAHAIDEGIVTGEAVNIAARFQSLAEPGRIVVGERTYRGARRAFGFTDLGVVHVKGIARPLRVFEVGDEIAAPRESGTTLEGRFVGRDSEIGLLRLLYARSAAEGRANLVTIVGPPGIGKSRLSREVARSLVAEGARVVRGRCLPYGDGLTYWPLAEILKADAGILDSDPLDVVRSKAHERLDPRFPGEEGMGVTAVLLSSIGVELASDPLAGTERDAAQGLIAKCWQRYLGSMASEAPLLVFLEDIHWADPSLLDLIETVVARMSGPALVVCTARPDLLERRPGWAGGLANATTISLAPLSAGEGAQLIEHLLDGSAPLEVVGPILHRSEGNPFFAGELLLMMVEDGTLAKRDGRWELTRELPTELPDTVQGVIASRLDLLTREEKRAIQDASVIGRHFWSGGVARLGSADVGRAIDGLIAKGLIREHSASSIEGEREFIFNHVLTRDVAYAGIPRSRRQRAHAAVGTWAEQLGDGRAEEFAEILAYHFEQAGDRKRTARYAHLAGQRLLRLFVADEAIGWFDRAIAATDPVDTSMRAQLALARGNAREQLGRYELARTDYDAAYADALEATDEVMAARAFAAATHVLMLLDRYDEGQERLVEALARARAVGLTDVEARLLYTAGALRFGRGEFADALHLHERALAIAREANDVEGQALAHHGLCENYFFQGPFEQGLVHGQEADRLFRELGQRQMVAHNAYMVAWLLGFSGRLEEALEIVDASIATSHDIGSAREEAFALFDRSEVHLSAGRLDAAMADAELGTSIFVDLGLSRGELVGRNVWCDVAAEVWSLEAIGEHGRRAMEISDALLGTFHRSLALAYVAWSALADGDPVGAQRWIGEARAIDGALLDVAWAGRIEVQMFEWAGDAGALDEIGSRIEELVLPTSAFWGAWGPYARSMAALLDGRHEEALEGAGRAMELGASNGERRLGWRAGRVAWKALEALGRLGEARIQRDAAASVAGEFRDRASGDLRQAFLARPDVSELLG